MSRAVQGPPWEFECVARNPDTLRNCPYSLYCAVCDMDDESFPARLPVDHAVKGASLTAPATSVAGVEKRQGNPPGRGNR